MIQWTLLAWVLLLVCYFFMPAPPPPEGNPNLPVNINYVYGLSDTSPQDWMEPHSYFALAMLLMPLLLFFPTHPALKKFMPAAGKRGPDRLGDC